MTERVHIRLFGEFAVSIDGSVFEVGDFDRRSGAELVQLLALSPDRRMHRDQVLDALWPDVHIDAAKNRFYKAASFARKALGDADAVVVGNESVLLFPHRQVDVDTDTVAAATAAEPEFLDRALQVGRHVLLPDALYADWASKARHHLRHKLLNALVDARRWPDVLELDPANEVASVAMMRQALESGDRQTVLRRFAALERHLREELSVEPSAAAFELRSRALADDKTETAG